MLQSGKQMGFGWFGNIHLIDALEIIGLIFFCSAALAIINATLKPTKYNIGTNVLLKSFLIQLALAVLCWLGIYLVIVVIQCKKFEHIWIHFAVYVCIVSAYFISRYMLYRQQIMRSRKVSMARRITETSCVAVGGALIFSLVWILYDMHWSFYLVTFFLAAIAIINEVVSTRQRFNAKNPEEWFDQYDFF